MPQAALALIVHALAHPNRTSPHFSLAHFSLPKFNCSTKMYTHRTHTLEHTHIAKCLLACSLSYTRQMSNVIFICLNNISVNFNHLNRSFVRSLARSSHFFPLSMNRFLHHFLAHVPMKMILWNWNEHKYTHTHTHNTRCIPRIRWSNKGKCLMFNTVFI